MSQNSSIADTVPTELYFKIFKLLKVPDLLKSRAVCKRWRIIIDELTNSEELWNRHCVSDFSDAYKIARKKSKSMPKQYFYRSLYLWSKLNSAEEDRDEFCYASAVRDEIQSFDLLRNNIIGVLKKAAVIYYDANTLRPVRRSPIFGAFVKYCETDNMILTSASYHRTYLTYKQDKSCDPELFENIKIYVLTDDLFFYATISNELFVWTIKDKLLKSLGHSEEGVIALGVRNNNLHVLSSEYRIFTVHNNGLRLTRSVNINNLIDVMHKYNLIDTIDWRMCFQWIYLLNRSISDSVLMDIITVKVYGNVVFIGTSWGVVRIYYRQRLEKFDIFNSQPVKQYNFMETFQCPVLSMSQILKIDCREEEDGHRVFVAMPKKIVVLTYKHFFKTFPELTELQPLKIINVN